MKRKYIEICEEKGWRVTKNTDGSVDLAQYSPAGEDFFFTVSESSFVEDVEEYAEGFDVDEHIQMWIEAKSNGVRGVPSARELVHDAEDIQEMLNELAEALTATKEETE